MQRFAQNLKYLRTSKKISQKDIAEYLNIADRQYRRYENSEVDIPLTIAFNISNYFDVSTDSRRGRTDNPTSPKL